MSEEEKYVRKYSERVFGEDDDIEKFIAFLIRANMLDKWGRGVMKFAHLESSGRNMDAILMLGKQVARQLTETSARRTVDCSHEEMDLLIRFTKILVSEFIRENYKQFDDITLTLTQILRSANLANGGIWDDKIEESLALPFMQKYENELRQGMLGDIVKIPEENGAPIAAEKISVEIFWDGRVESLRFVSDFISKDLGWVKSGDDFYAFFYKDSTSPIDVTINKKQLEKVGLLILFLKFQNEIKIANSKAIWQRIADVFKLEGEDGAKIDWSKRISKFKKDRVKVKKFIVDIQAIISHLGVDDEDCMKFLGKIG